MARPAVNEQTAPAGRPHRATRYYGARRCSDPPSPGRPRSKPVAAKYVRQRLHAVLERAIAVNLRDDNRATGSGRCSARKATSCSTWRRCRTVRSPGRSQRCGRRVRTPPSSSRSSFWSSRRRDRVRCAARDGTRWTRRPAYVSASTENIAVGDVCGPTVRRSRGGVKGLVRIAEPLRPDVVEVRQRALLERLRRVLVTRKRTLRVAGNRLVDPPARIQPAVAQLDQASGFQGYCHLPRVGGVFSGRDVRRQAGPERERLERRAGHVQRG